MSGLGESRVGGGIVSLAVASGKGGVGKTNVVINLAVALARLRHRVAILDADFGLGNVDVLLGLAPDAHLGHVLAGERTLAEILIEGPRGVMVIPASSGVRQLTALGPAQWAAVNRVLDEVAAAFDYLVIDTAAGISDNVLTTLGLAERVLVVTSLEPTAVVDAYAMIKLLSVSDPTRDVGLLVNNARDASEAQLVFSQLEVAVTRFLQRRLTYYGFIPHDPGVRDAVLVQRPVVDDQPQSAASRPFRILASRLAGMDAHRAGLRLVTAPARPVLCSDPEAPRCA
jgi:flagellar biosynthesis protein FlhG